MVLLSSIPQMSEQVPMSDVAVPVLLFATTSR
jgi:hypothetical protein